jgi:hypothetical protein
LHRPEVQHEIMDSLQDMLDQASSASTVRKDRK